MFSLYVGEIAKGSLDAKFGLEKENYFFDRVGPHYEDSYVAYSECIYISASPRSIWEATEFITGIFIKQEPWVEC